MKPCKHPLCPDDGPCRKAKVAPTWRAKPKPMSDKRSRELALYRKERIKYLKDHPQCEARLWCCIGSSSEIHHKQGRENELLNDQSKWLAICPSCHRYITDNSHEAIELGLSISKHKKAS